MIRPTDLCLAVPASVFLLLSLTAQAEEVVWKNAVGVSVSGNNLTKTVSTGWGNSGASSIQSIESAGYVEFVATETNTLRTLGLSYGDTNQDWTDVDFGIALNSDATVHVHQQGAYSGPYTTYASGDRFRVEVGDGVVRYRKNGVVFYTSANSPRMSLVVDTALYGNGATLTNVEVGRGGIVADTGVFVIGQTITKTGSTGWNAGAISAERAFWGDALLEFTATETNKQRAAGLSRGDTNADVTDIDFAVVLKTDATVEIMEAGTSRGGFGPYATTDRFRVEAVGGRVKYYRNGVLLYTSTRAPSYPLLADTAFDTAGGTLTDVVVSDIVWSMDSGVTLAGSSLVKTGSAGWNAGAISTASLTAGDGFVEFSATETNTDRMCGLGTGDSGPSDGDIEFAIQLTSAGEIKVYESGTLKGTYGPYTNGDRFRVELREGTVRYRRNGSTFYTSAATPSYPLTVDTSLHTTGATLSEVLFGNITWKNETGVAVRGYELTKTTTSTAWGDSGAATTSALTSGDGYVEFMATEKISWRMVGFSNGDSNANYTDIDFGLGLGHDGQIYVYEQGSYVGSYGPYSPGDRMRVSIEGGVVTYRRNGTLLVTSTRIPAYPLLVDTALYTPNATISAVFMAATATAVAAPTLSPAGASSYANVSVQISCVTPGATIHYTLNDADPTPSDTSIASGSSVVIDQSRTLKARAFKPGLVDSAVVTGVYTLTVPLPSFTPGGGGYTAPQNVTVTSSVAGATIRYTTNNQDPIGTDATIASGSSILIDTNLTLKLKAWKAGWTPSAVTWGDYVFTVANPVITPAPGAYSSAQNVTFSTTTPGAVIRYTTDGREPTASDPSGTSVAVNRSMTVKAMGVRAGWTPSATSVASYVLTLGTVATPIFSPPPGTYASGQSVTISSGTKGATIRYTVDGTAPTLTSPLYSGPVSVAASGTLKARAFREDYSPSGTASADYTIDGTRAAIPTIGPAAGRFASGLQVTISSITPGATIRYTTTGIDPTDTDEVIASGSTIVVGRSLRVKAKAWKSGLTPSAVAVADYDIVGSVAAGEQHTLVLKSDGTVWGFGGNYTGQVGDTTSEDRRTPVQVSGLSNVVAITAGSLHSLALKADSSVWAWGANDMGQIGDGTGASRFQPVAVLSGGVPLTGVVAIAAGRYHSLALKEDGSVFAWGGWHHNWDGGHFIDYQAVQVPSLSGVSAISAGAQHSVALKTNGAAAGTAWVWGQNHSGQLGTGTTLTGSVPTKVADDVTAVAAGALGTFLGKPDGTFVATGRNGEGQLGDGTKTSRTIFQAGFLAPGVTRLSAGGYHTLALKSDATVWGCGYNITGEVGDGTFGQFMERTIPVKAALIRDVVAVAAGRQTPSIYVGAMGHSVALTADGRVWTWGTNYYGQLGDGTAPGDTKPNPRPLQEFSASDRTWPAGDPDGDGLRNELELQLGSNPFNADTNGDGIRDGAAYGAGLSLTNTDMDEDGALNAVEIAQGTDPFRSDSDGDATGDATDCFPLDPTRWVCPSSNPSDHTPPTLTLTEPTNATLISSTP